MDRALFVEALRRFNPSKAAEGSLALARPSWDPLSKLLLQLEADVRFRLVLHGSIGVGKTTELLRWRRLLEAAGVPCSYHFFQSKTKLHQTIFSEISTSRLLLLDGLDLQSDQAERWFGHGTALVDPELPALVAVAPHAIMRWPPDKRDPKLELLHLPPFPVLHRSGRANWEGVAAMRRMLEVRLEELDIFEKPSLLGRIVLMSGGVPRDAVRLMRGCLLAAAARGAKVSMGDVVAGERELRQDYEHAFTKGDYNMLSEVATESKFLHADPRLLTMGAVLSYEDQEGSYARPHPVLMSTLGPKLSMDLVIDAAAAGNAP